MHVMVSVVCIRRCVKDAHVVVLVCIGVHSVTDKLAYEKQKSVDALKDMENIKNREVSDADL